MQISLKVFGIAAAGWAFAFCPVAPASTAEVMPVAEQNALVQKYCAVCHTDASRNGGLSLSHFDAAQTPPSLAAMLVSKITSGVSLETVKAAASDPVASALVENSMKSGAMGAAGIPIPDQATIHALVAALAGEAKGATQWSISQAQNPTTKTQLVVASTLRELPSAKTPAQAAMYRLVLSCDVSTRQGEMQLAWAPMSTRGKLSASVDGAAPVIYPVDGTEKMGNGSAATTGPAALSFSTGNAGSGPVRSIPLPARTLRISSLFPDQAVEFSFDDLARADRQSLSACFTATSPAR